MKKIGGNTILILKRKKCDEANEIGEHIYEELPYIELKGYLDMSSTNTTHATYNAKLQDSTHFFICDYVELPKVLNEDYTDRVLNADELVAYCNNKEFDVLWIDNPMELNQQLEIYLSRKGV